MRSLLLGIETGGDYVSVALSDPAVPGGRPVVRTDVYAPRDHARLLMRLVEAAFDLAGATPDDLTTVAVAVGPGAYSGIRVGIATALGLASAAGTVALGIPSLRAAAFADARAGDGLVVAALPAGRGGVYVQPHAWPLGARAPVAAADPARIDGSGAAAYLDGVARQLGEVPLVVGPGVSLMATPGSGRVRRLARAPAHVFAADVAALAQVALEEGWHDGQTMAVAPIYLRPAASPPGAAGAAR